ncbi:hypothetical protein WJX74_006555 [Apatococcus lobatus]|uniref:Methyltransferase domain-containing protein n=1 Tax=Apatococcus lobatus TaxID=904363 RepID=A0AAW1S6G3_9CHLO
MALTSRMQQPRFLQQSQYKERLKTFWTGRGSSCDVNNTFHPKVAHELVARAQLRKGWRVLELCTGTGMVALEAAELVGASGHVVGVDISASMLQEAQERVASCGRAGIGSEVHAKGFQSAHVWEKYETLPFRGMDAAALSEFIWIMLLNTPFTQLESVIPKSRLADLQPSFLERAIPMAQEWTVGRDIIAPHAHLWAIASK